MWVWSVAVNMRPLQSIQQRVLATLQRSTLLAASVGILLATASVVYGITNDDLLTALGAGLLVPSIVLLYAIGTRGHDVEFGSTPQ